jgi:hypothetical protein
MNSLKNRTISLLMILTISMGNILRAQEIVTDEQLLDLYTGLHVADVCDGMDMVGLRHAGADHSVL